MPGSGGRYNSRERMAIELQPRQQLSARFRRSRTCCCDAAHGLRSRVRRFESCWGRFFEYLIDHLMNYRNALTCKSTNKIKSARPMRGPDTAQDDISAGRPCFSERVV